MRSSDDDGGGPPDFEPKGVEPPQEASGVTITGAHQAVGRERDEDAPPEASLDDWSFVRGTSPDPELPHWTEAPTGQVPAVLARDTGEPPSDDPWSALPSPTWRQDETDWTSHEESFEPAMLGDEGGAAPVHGDDARRPWEFDDQDATVQGTVPTVGTATATEAAVPATRVRARTSRTRRGAGGSRGEATTSSGSRGSGAMTGRSARPAVSRDMPVAIMTGLGLGLLVIIAYDVSTVLMAILAAVVVVVAAGEAYSGMRLAGHRPAAALGLVACLSLMIASYNKGITALPLVTALCFLFTFLWYLAGVEHADVLDGVGSSLVVYVWVGVLGSFAGLLLAPSTFPQSRGVHFLLAAIIVTVANDVGALVFGKLLGRRPMASTISPNKTWEGAIGAAAVTVIAGACVSLLPDWSLSAGLALGIAAAVLAPLGDLCESMFKRSLGLKDMGRTLPGHGGLLDRVDGLLFVLPATYYIVLAYHLG
ncbi:MAG TPA: phosphatidate cytidylyltransferase [Acidimicrobiales bacterium]|nr:phosphatidate cytidylyltransferase [Acidimicrobiales bacterium]